MRNVLIAWAQLLFLFPVRTYASGFPQENYSQKTNIPTVYIETYDGLGITSKTEYKKCRFVFVSNNTIDKIDSVLVRGRGNASWNFDKKPYRIKFPKKIKLLGEERANAKSWVLQSNGGEKLLFRNGLANYVSSLCKMPFTPATEFVDFYLNGEYLGNYQITDFVDIRKKRVEIAEMDTFVTDINADITGGYLLEVDYRTDEGKTYIKSPVYNNNIRIHSPKPEVINKEQIKYITDIIGEFEDVLSGGNYTDPINGWYQYVDSASIMGWYLTNEICANCDMFAQIYFYKDRGEDKFFFSPVWDFDLGFNDDTRRGDGGDVTRYLMQDIDFGKKYYKSWFDRITSDPWWIQAQFDAYEKLYIDKNLDSLMNNYVDSIVRILRPSVEENYKVWSISKQTHLEYKLYSSYDQYVDDLRTFIKDHNLYIYEQFKERAKGVESGIGRPDFVKLGDDINYMLSYNRGNKCLHFLSEYRRDLNFMVSVYTLSGFCVGTFWGFEDFDTTALSNGIYIVRWKIGKNQRSAKFVKD